MPNIVTVLKAEIARIARKETRAETQSLKSTNAKLRSDMAALKREVASLKRELRRSANAPQRAQRLDSETSADVRHRFSAKGLASQRKRLGLSAESLGKLIGVSGLSIYHWEGGKARPRAKHLPAIAALKTLGKKEANAVLASR